VVNNRKISAATQSIPYPVRVEIDLDAITHNLREIRRFISPRTRIMAIVKADAYGHGAEEVALTAYREGVEMLGVTRVEEGIRLRQANITLPILVLSPIIPAEVPWAVDYNLTLTITNLEIARLLSQYTIQSNKTVKVHVKVDTGMGRLGILPEETTNFVSQILKLPRLELEGIFSHFASADVPEDSFTGQQLHCFQEIIERLQKNGIEPPLQHIANSAAIVNIPDSHLDIVRPGLLIYGIPPSRTDTRLKLRPALTLKTTLIDWKEVPPGWSISYGRTYTCHRKEKVGIIPAGYANGFDRAFSNRGEVLIQGKRVPVRGRVCMDLCMVGLDQLPGVTTGEEVVLIGSSGGERISIWDWADRLGTIVHEIPCAISHRVPRVYLSKGKVVKIKSLTGKGGQERIYNL